MINNIYEDYSWYLDCKVQLTIDPNLIILNFNSSIENIDHLIKFFIFIEIKTNNFN